MIPASPMRKLKLPRPKRPEKISLTVDQTRAFVAAADAAGWGPLFRFWIDAGPRPSELFALELADYDRTKGEVRFLRAIDDVSREVKDLKTERSRRVVILSTSTRAALEEHLKGLKGNLLFPALEGGYWWKATLTSVAFRPVCRAAKTPNGFRPYDLRHTMASLLLQAGVSVKVVSERLGHDDIQTTLRHYAHVLPGMQEAAAAKMNEILSVPLPHESPTSKNRQPVNKLTKNAKPKLERT